MVSEVTSHHQGNHKSHDYHVMSVTDGEWVKLDEIFVGLKGKKDFFETRDFLVDPAAPSSLAVQFVLKIDGELMTKPAAHLSHTCVSAYSTGKSLMNGRVAQCCS